MKSQKRNCFTTQLKPGVRYSAYMEYFWPFTPLSAPSKSFKYRSHRCVRIAQHSQQCANSQKGVPCLLHCQERDLAQICTNQRRRSRIAAVQYLISSPSDVGSYHREASHRTQASSSAVAPSMTSREAHPRSFFLHVTLPLTSSILFYIKAGCVGVPRHFYSFLCAPDVAVWTDTECGRGLLSGTLTYFEFWLQMTIFVTILTTGGRNIQRKNAWAAATGNRTQGLRP